MDIGPLPCHAANAEVRSSETRQIDLLVKPKLFSVNCFSGGGQTFEQDFKLILAFDKTDHTVWVGRVNEFQRPVLETDRAPLDANASGLIDGPSACRHLLMRAADGFRIGLLGKTSSSPSS